YYCLAYGGNRFQRDLFSFDFLDPAIDLVDDDNRGHYLVRLRGVDNAVVLRCLRSFGEPLGPAIAVDTDHARSRSSRRSLLLKPGIMPLVSRSGRTGTYCSIPFFTRATILSPALMPASLRSFSG